MRNDRVMQPEEPSVCQQTGVDILHVIGAFVAGGAERFVVDLVLSLAKKGAVVGVIALSQKKDNVGLEMIRHLDSSGVRHARGPADKVGLKSIKWYCSKLREMRPAIVHLHTENTELAHYLATFIFRKEHFIVRTMHTTNRSSNRLHWHAIYNNRADVSIACGKAVLETFKGEIKGKLVTVPNGIDFYWPVQNMLIKAAQKSRLGLETDKYHFLNVGNQKGVSPESAAKAHDVLIKAWREGGLSNRGASLHLVGDGNLQAQLKQLADGDDGIHFHGIREDVHNWLLAADCFVMPSRYEGLPIAAIEAVATGLPAIFSDIESLQEFEGSAITRVRTDDIKGLSNKMLMVMSGNEDFDGAVDVDVVRSKYGISGASDNYLNVYSELLAGNPNSGRSRMMT